LKNSDYLDLAHTKEPVSPTLNGTSRRDNHLDELNNLIGNKYHGIGSTTLHLFHHMNTFSVTKKKMVSSSVKKTLIRYILELSLIQLAQENMKFLDPWDTLEKE
jgi:hypothetical protein